MCHVSFRGVLVNGFWSASKGREDEVESFFSAWLNHRRHLRDETIPLFGE